MVEVARFFSLGTTRFLGRIHKSAATPRFRSELGSKKLVDMKRKKATHAYPASLNRLGQA